MLAFSPAKINVGLHVGHKRPDGYHDLETLLYPIQWCDAVEVIATDKDKWVETGLSSGASPDHNLCKRAYALLAKDYTLPPLDIRLHKCVPVGAGLGGGSANAATTLKLINELCALKIPLKTLRAYAEQLGSDCPFFLENKVAFAQGKGERLTDYPPILEGQHLVVLCGAVSISTAEAYATLPVPRAPLAKRPLKKTLANTRTEWPKRLFNDFKNALSVRRYPILELEDTLYQAGAWYASLTGSGAAVYGLFETKPDLSAFENFGKSGYWWYEQMK